MHSLYLVHHQASCGLRMRSEELAMITFRFPATIWAETVDLVANLDGAEDQRYTMVYSRPDDAWQVTLEMPEGRSYDHSYLLNGREVCNEWSQPQSWPEGANQG